MTDEPRPSDLVRDTFPDAAGATDHRVQGSVIFTF